MICERIDHIVGCVAAALHSRTINKAPGDILRFTFLLVLVSCFSFVFATTLLYVPWLITTMPTFKCTTQSHTRAQSKTFVQYFFRCFQRTNAFRSTIVGRKKIAFRATNRRFCLYFFYFSLDSVIDKCIRMWVCSLIVELGITSNACANDAFFRCSKFNQIGRFYLVIIYRLSVHRNPVLCFFMFCITWPHFTVLSLLYFCWLNLGCLTGTCSKAYN